MGWVLGGTVLAWLYAGWRQRAERRWQDEYAVHVAWMTNMRGTG